jgi:hypothetical protein
MLRIQLYAKALRLRKQCAEGADVKSSSLNNIEWYIRIFLEPISHVNQRFRKNIINRQLSNFVGGIPRSENSLVAQFCALKAWKPMSHTISTTTL